MTTESVTLLDEIQRTDEPWIRYVQKYPEEASADCPAEGEFDPSSFRILTDEIILADMPTKVIVGLRYGEKELDIDVSGKDSDDELFVNVWYKGQCYSPSETERLPADFVAKWKADNPSYDWENPNVSMDEEMFNEVLRRMKYRLQDCDVLCRENCNRIECTINCSLGRVWVTGHLHTVSAGIIQGVEELEVHDLNEVANGNICELQTEIGTSSEVLKELLMRFV